MQPRRRRNKDKWVKLIVRKLSPRIPQPVIGPETELKDELRSRIVICINIKNSATTSPFEKALS